MNMRIGVLGLVLCAAVFISVAAGAAAPALSFADEDGAGASVPVLLRNLQAWERKLHNLSLEYESVAAHHGSKKVWLLQRVAHTRTGARQQRVSWSVHLKAGELSFPEDPHDLGWSRELATRVEAVDPMIWWTDGRRQTLFTLRTDPSRYVGCRYVDMPLRATAAECLEGSYYRTAPITWLDYVPKFWSWVRATESGDGSAIVILAKGDEARSYTVLISRSTEHPPHTRADIVAAKMTASGALHAIPSLDLSRGTAELGESALTVRILEWLAETPEGVPPLPALVIVEMPRRSHAQLWRITKASVPEASLPEGAIPGALAGKTIEIYDELHRQRILYHLDGGHEVLGTYGPPEEKGGASPVFPGSGPARTLRVLLLVGAIGSLLMLLAFGVRARAILPGWSRW